MHRYVLDYYPHLCWIISIILSIFPTVLCQNITAAYIMELVGRMYLMEQLELILMNY